MDSVKKKNDQQVSSFLPKKIVSIFSKKKNAVNG